MNIKTIKIGLSILAICILFLDFFVINEFNIERGYLGVFALLLFLNSYRLAFGNKIQMNLICLFVNLSLLGFLFYNAQVLAILSFGIGFIGRSFPLIMGMAILVNLGLIGVLIIETIKLISTIMKSNFS